MLSLYPGLSYSPPDYLTYVGLWLNRGRVRAAQAMAVKEGTELALGRGRVPYPYCRAVTDSDAEANDLELRLNSARRAAAVAARLGI